MVMRVDLPPQVAGLVMRVDLPAHNPFLSKAKKANNPERSGPTIEILGSFCANNKLHKR